MLCCMPGFMLVTNVAREDKDNLKYKYDVTLSIIKSEIDYTGVLFRCLFRGF
jgi:hypothetical protein